MLFHWGYVSGVLISSTAKSVFQIGLLLSLSKKEKKKGKWSFTVRIDHIACSVKHVSEPFHYLIWCSQRILCWWINLRLRRSKMLSSEIKLLNYYSWSKIKKCRCSSEIWQFRLCRLVSPPSSLFWFFEVHNWHAWIGPNLWSYP